MLLINYLADVQVSLACSIVSISLTWLKLLNLSIRTSVLKTALQYVLTFPHVMTSDLDLNKFKTWLPHNAHPSPVQLIHINPFVPRDCHIEFCFFGLLWKSQ